MKFGSLIVWVFLFLSAFGLQESWADSQTSFDGHWYGTIECKGDDIRQISAYTKNVSIEVNGSEVILGNFGDYTQGDPFSHKGSIEVEGGFFLKPGDIGFPMGSSNFSNRTIQWLLGGEWVKNSFILTGERDGMECSGTLEPGKSEQVEEARLAAAELKKQKPDEGGFGSAFEKLTSGISSGFSDIASQIGGSAEPKAEEASSTTKQASSQEAGALGDQKKSPAENEDASSYIGSLASAISGGGGAWGGIVRNFKGALTIIAKQAGVMGEVIADLAEALGLKVEAAALRKEAKNISEKGDALGADDLDAIRTISESTQVLITERLAESTVLDAKQKAKMAEAAVKYVPAMFKSVQAGIQLASVASSATSAGLPGVIEGIAVASAAVDIPVLVPKAISFVSNSVEAGQRLTDIMREKDIAVPDTSSLNDEMAKMK